MCEYSVGKRDQPTVGGLEMKCAKDFIDSEPQGSIFDIQRVPNANNQQHTKRHRSSSRGDDKEENHTRGPLRKYTKLSESNVISHSTQLHLPHASDPPTTLTAKLTAILTSLSSPRHQSLAASTHYLATPTPNRDPIAKAMSEKHPDERWQRVYISNPQTIRVLAIDWATDTLPAPKSAKPLKIAERRAEALNRMYNTNLARPGHVRWFTENCDMGLPLVKAMARVIGAETDLCGGREGVVKAELQTVNVILRVLGDVVGKRKGEVDGALLLRVQSVLGTERRRLRGLVGGQDG